MSLCAEVSSIKKSIKTQWNLSLHQGGFATNIRIFLILAVAESNGLIKYLIKRIPHQPIVKIVAFTGHNGPLNF